MAIIRLLFGLWSLVVRKIVGYSPVGRSSLVGELWHPAIDNDTARGFVRGVQIPALVVVVIKECWSVKNDIRNRLERRSGQMVVRKGPAAGEAAYVSGR